MNKGDYVKQSELRQQGWELVTIFAEKIIYAKGEERILFDPQNDYVILHYKSKMETAKKNLQELRQLKEEEDEKMRFFEKQLCNSSMAFRN